MTKDLLFSDYKELITKKFSNAGWVIAYSNQESLPNVAEGDSAGIYSALIPQAKIKKALSNYNWDLRLGNGHPGFCFTYENGKEKAKYVRFEDGIEPLVYYRSFFGIREKYFDLSEEFRLFHNLYEDLKDSNSKKYIHINDNGDEEEVAILTRNEVKIKLKFLIEYLSARKMCFAVYFEFMRFLDKNLIDLSLNESEETIDGENFIYNHLIRTMDISFDNNKTQSWLMGKVIIRGDVKFQAKLNDKDNKKYEEFFIKYDDDGSEVFYTCNEDKLSNYFGKNPGLPHYLTPVYFKKEVLNKYYENPNKYSVQDGIIFCQGLWSLRLDNNHRDYVVVYLGDLGHLHHNEQLYWKSFNISPQNGISRTAWLRNFEGEFADPDNPDLYIKMKYKSFAQKWFEKYKWNLFKPLNSDDEHHFSSLHIPATNNQKEFDEQVLSLTKVIIDSLNEKKLTEGIQLEKDSAKGIDKFEIFLKSKSLNIPEMIQFLRNLQTMRSTTVAHRKSEKNKDRQRIIEYFELDKRTLIEVFTEILIKVIWIFNTLEKHLLEE